MADEVMGSGGGDHLNYSERANIAFLDDLHRAAGINALVLALRPEAKDTSVADAVRALLAGLSGPELYATVALFSQVELQMRNIGMQPREVLRGPAPVLDVVPRLQQVDSSGIQQVVIPHVAEPGGELEKEIKDDSSVPSATSVEEAVGENPADKPPTPDATREDVQPELTDDSEESLGSLEQPSTSHTESEDPDELAETPTVSELAEQPASEDVEKLASLTSSEQADKGEIETDLIVDNLELLRRVKLSPVSVIHFFRQISEATEDSSFVPSFDETTTEDVLTRLIGYVQLLKERNVPAKRSDALSTDETMIRLINQLRYENRIAGQMEGKSPTAVLLFMRKVTKQIARYLDDPSQTPALDGHSATKSETRESRPVEEEPNRVQLAERFASLYVRADDNEKHALANLLDPHNKTKITHAGQRAVLMISGELLDHGLPLEHPDLLLSKAELYRVRQILGLFTQNGKIERRSSVMLSKQLEHARRSKGTTQRHLKDIEESALQGMTKIFDYIERQRGTTKSPESPTGARQRVAIIDGRPVLESVG